MVWRYKHCPQPNQSINWDSIYQKYDYFEVLEATPQSPIYHAEGNVWIHTKMVCEELMQLREWQELNETNRSVLFLSALLHDIGKGTCTRTEMDGRITSPKHAVVGSLMTRQLLWKEVWHEIPFALRERVVSLVRYHGLPLWFDAKRNPEKAIITAAETTNLKHLSILSEADLKGRICADKDELLFRIELFRERSEDLNCFEIPYPFSSDMARFTYFNSPESNRFYEPYDNEAEAQVTVMSALPGAGKDTYVQKNLKGLPIISLDELRRQLKISPKGEQGKVIQAAKEQARVHLRKKESFVWNATNITRQVRSTIIGLFTTYKARINIIYIEPPYKTLIAQNEGREAIVPRKVVERMIKRLQIPDTTEAHRVKYVVGA